MPTLSILFPQEDLRLSSQEPASFHDLALDQFVDAVTAGREPDELRPYFCTQPRSVQTIDYRQEVFRDLDGQPALDTVTAFGEQMRAMRQHLGQLAKVRYRYQRAAWFRDAVERYCRAVGELFRALAATELSSAGLRSFRTYLDEYTRSADFCTMQEESSALKEALADVRYCLHINGDRVRVSSYDGQADYSETVEQTFRRFQQGAVTEHRIKLSASSFMNHVEEEIVDRVALVQPDVFATLDAFPRRWEHFLDPTVAGFDREAQFYLSYLAYIAPLRAAGLPFCYPEVSAAKQVSAQSTFDLVLAGNLVRDGGTVVGNDFELRAGERIFVVSGPNQGGKTTFARTFGQLHTLAGLGLLVPGTSARMFLFDQVFTHFEREEKVTDLRSKLEDDLMRVHDILGHATAASILILNEVFTSTTLHDARNLGERVLRQILDLDLLCVYVTFVDELTTLDERVVSMVSTVDPDDPATRTYRVLRQPADGLAHAVAIAEKYRLTFEKLQQRLAR